jgi:acetyl-CoA acyltransferase
MENVFVCDAIRTPIGRYGGALATTRTDDLASFPIKELMKRNPNVDWNAVDEVFYGCANQAGEDNRNVARMAILLSGLPFGVPAVTLNRLCGSGMDAIGSAARAIMSGEMDLSIAGGVESMSRAPYVMGKSDKPFGRSPEFFDTTMAWRFVNKKMQTLYGTESMPETAENVAEKYGVSREDQDIFALNSQIKTKKAQDESRFDDEIFSVEVSTRKGSIFVDKDEHPRSETTAEGLAGLKTPFRENGSVTAGNASGLNDGACAVLLANEKSINAYGLEPLARVVGMATSGVEPKYMGVGPVEAASKLLARFNLSINDIDVIELNEAFAAQALACMQLLNIPKDHPGLNPNGGAIALGHPLGMSGARLVTTAAYQLKRTGGRFALCTMCIGVGQGIAILIENVNRSAKS